MRIDKKIKKCVKGKKGVGLGDPDNYAVTLSIMVSKGFYENSSANNNIIEPS